MWKKGVVENSKTDLHVTREKILARKQFKFMSEGFYVAQSAKMYNDANDASLHSLLN